MISNGSAPQTVDRESATARASRRSSITNRQEVRLD